MVVGADAGLLDRRGVLEPIACTAIASEPAPTGFQRCSKCGNTADRLPMSA